jgi:uracil-DNA glycosylase family 4
MASDSLERLASEVIVCRKCPRLVRYRESVARVKRAAYRDWTYWGRPVPGFGDSEARLLVVGLAPAAHGGNRTGRPFTGDRSGDWLYRALHRAGFANQPTSVSRDDGLALRDCYIVASVRCAPPQNKPTRVEFARCQPYLARELMLLKNAQVVIVLGAVAMRSFLSAWKATDHEVEAPLPKFRHGGSWSLPPIALLASYHPSQRNTQTGLLTEAMFDRVFRRARRILGDPRNRRVSDEAKSTLFKVDGGRETGGSEKA